MKTRLNLWETGFLTLLVITAVLVGGCDKAPTSTADKSGNQPPAPIQAEAFRGQVYKSFNQRKVLTLISKDECELSEHGTILLCKYTKQDDKLRVVTTALGTSQVLYYRFTSQGLQDNDGNVLFSPEGLLEAQRQAELARRAQQEAREAAERQRAEAAAAAARQAEKEANEREEARKKREELALTARSTSAPVVQVECFGFNHVRKFRFVVTTVGVSTELISVMDAFGAWEKPSRPQRQDIWFDELTEKPGYSTTYRTITLKSDRLGRVEFNCTDRKTEAAADHLAETFKLLEKAIDSWRSKYPALARW